MTNAKCTLSNILAPNAVSTLPQRHLITEEHLLKFSSTDNRQNQQCEPAASLKKDSDVWQVPKYAPWPFLNLTLGELLCPFFSSTDKYIFNYLVPFYTFLPSDYWMSYLFKQKNPLFHKICYFNVFFKEISLINALFLMYQMLTLCFRIAPD